MLAVDAPASAVTVAPAQLVPVVGAAATTMPVGKVSVSVPPLTAIAPGLLLRIWTVSVDTPPSATVGGEKDLLSVTAAVTRLIVALAAAGLTNPSVDVTAPAG